MTRARRRTAQRGVTLLEVMLSVVILASGVSVVAAGLSSSIRAEAHAENRIRASMVLKTLIAHLESGALAVDNATGDFEADFPEDVPWRRIDEAATAVGEEQPLGDGRFTYQIAVDTTDIENLQQLTITVAWLERGALRTIEVQRLWNDWPNAQALADEAAAEAEAAAEQGGGAGAGGGR